MKQIHSFYFILIFLFLNCSSDEDLLNQPLNGQTYRLTSILMDVAVDLNNDGVSSFDVMTEETLTCFEDNSIPFDSNSASPPVTYVSWFSFDSNTNSYNNSGCDVIDYAGPWNYYVENELVYLFIDDDVFIDSSPTVGRISGNTISFQVDWIVSYMGLNVLYDENGQQFQYEGDASLVFTLQNN